MRFDRATISLAPRSTKNCLDLAVVFLRRYFLPLTALWATVAVPACSLTWYMLQRFDGTMYVALAMFCLATSPLGILIVAGAAPCAFGEPFT
jgi:hypothetical protein